jgi:hypothetical protein
MAFFSLNSAIFIIKISDSDIEFSSLSLLSHSLISVIEVVLSQEFLNGK